MSIGETVAVFASGVAVATSISGVAISLVALRRGRTHLRLTSAFALTGALNGMWVVMVGIINDGGQPEIVTGGGFEDDGKRMLFLTRPDHYPEGAPPRKVLPNESMTMMISARELRMAWQVEKLGRLQRIFVNTQSGHAYQVSPRSDIVEYASKGWYTGSDGKPVRLGNVEPEDEEVG